MQITRFDLHNVRNLQPTSLRPGSGLNLLLGDNGAGKTSVLEGLHLMAYGRSFRGRVRDGLVQRGREAVELYAEWREDPTHPERIRRAGLRHTGQDWSGRLDGEDVAQLGDLCAALMVVTFEPGSHALISGSSEVRRRFLDWGLFHVEQDFLQQWRRYARALRQRNALLKSGAGGSQLDAWDHELADAAVPLDTRREAYLQRLQIAVQAVAEQVAPALGAPELVFLPGWRRHELSLSDALMVARDRDRAAGHTSVGPHRADWRIRFDDRPEQSLLSRGQAKQSALCCLLAQARDCARRFEGRWPVIALDDLASELDRHHQRQVLTYLRDAGAQVLITGTERPDHWPDNVLDNATTFHVEHGVVRDA
ncbi:DNA replication/repair protein RecF [Luteimonas terrae]|uniref:DNA replication and repair protein RecF n=1 Tax=Luteimonas terrae TaxID=1530191 RepID=A0ABU1Y0D9_9GAMM|nr:DNA replication/repair protein RecF [Luteimonas terrae]MDR7194490.1 DNA replication and repair protein RecF [Luteimonas terrae]